MSQGRLPLAGMTAAVEVARCGSFVAAARALGRSSSAVSKSIAQLEAELGVKLFHRTTRSVQPTSEGARYVESVRPLLQGLSEVNQVTVEHDAPLKGTLRVSVPAAFGRVVLAPRMAQFHRHQPSLRLDLRFEDRKVELAAEAVDVAIRSGSLEERANLQRVRVMEDPLVLCASGSYLDERGVPESVAELTRHTRVGFRSRRTGRVEEWRLEAAATLEPTLLGDDVEALAKMAMAGAGIARVPKYLVAGALDAGTLVEVLPSLRSEPVPFWAVYLERRLVSPKVRAFIDFVRSLEL